MLPAETTVLVELQLIWSIPFVFCCGVVPLLALGAGKGDNVTHSAYLLNLPSAKPEGSDSLRIIAVLLDNFTHHTGTYCTATFADCKAQFFVHGDRGDQLGSHGNIVAGHNHLNSFR